VLALSDGQCLGRDNLWVSGGEHAPPVTAPRVARSSTVTRRSRRF
jgi:hypothetical protein